MGQIKTYFRCEAAGRENNEDNGKILDLGNKGTLLVVCDGMGGMNAGEVASALAVATVEKSFEPERLTADVMSQPMEYLKQVIIGADANIKNYSKSHPETEGMGSTAVLAWLIDSKVYVAWCGDSRAYRYNPQLGLERLSHDHSLVQTWVDAGQITEEQAFNHPQGNIITRSLGDPQGAAMPEAAEFALYDNDVLLLCSDGLCGTLRDSEIEPIMAQNTDLKACCDQLWKADEAAGWHDNVTTAMAQVVSGGAMLSMAAQAEPKEVEVMEEEYVPQKKSALSNNMIYYIVLALLVAAALIGYRIIKQKPAPEPEKTEQPEVKDPANQPGSEDQPSSNNVDSQAGGTTTPATAGATGTQKPQDNNGASTSEATGTDSGDDNDADGDKKTEKQIEAAKNHITNNNKPD